MAEGFASLVSGFGRRLSCLVRGVLAPAQCCSCMSHWPGPSGLCDNCLKNVVRLPAQLLKITPLRTVRLVPYGAYSGSLRELVLAKEGGDPAPIRILGRMMASCPDILDLKADFVVPVPLHWKRLLRRGYNQAHLLAGLIAEAKGCKVLEAVKRTKNTVRQSRLSALDRAVNVNASFTLCTGMSDKIRGRAIVVIDDLLTTGCTVKEVVKTICRARPSAVAVAVAAKAI